MTKLLPIDTCVRCIYRTYTSLEHNNDYSAYCANTPDKRALPTRKVEVCPPIPDWCPLDTAEFNKEAINEKN